MPNGQKIIKTFYDAWWFLEQHPAFVRVFSKNFSKNRFQDALDIYVAKVSPKSNHICDDKRKNTKTQVWLECGKWLTAEQVMPKGMKPLEDYYGAFCHDMKLDCGADTFEEAIIKLANLVLKEYGNYSLDE